MQVIISQQYVHREVAKNKEQIIALLEAARPDDWYVFPECALSGYFPEETWFLKDVSPDDIETALDEIAAIVKKQRCYCLLGSAVFSKDNWYNSAVLMGPDGIVDMYHKKELSNWDAQHFAAGTQTPVYEMGGVRFGVQICREVIFPEAWVALKKQHAQIAFHLNNAIKPYDDLWEHILIARAIENGYFVGSANNAAPPQELTSYLINPTGKTLLKATRQTEQAMRATIDLDATGKPY